MIGVKDDRLREGDTDQNLLPGGRPFAPGELTRLLINAVHPVLATVKWEFRIVAVKCRVPAIPSRVAEAISTSAGELTRVGTFPDGGFTEWLSARPRPMEQFTRI